MSTRRVRLEAQVLRREQLSPQLVRLVVGGEELSVDQSTGLPDEWVGLVVPGQFQTRFYTVRSWVEGEVTLDVVVHDAGLVTDWATGDCIGDAIASRYVAERSQMERRPRRVHFSTALERAGNFNIKP